MRRRSGLIQKKKNQREFEFAIDANLCVKFSFHLALMNLAEKVIEILLDFLMNFIFLLFLPPPFYRSLKGLPLPRLPMREFEIPIS